ncbi:polyketide synthase [Cystobacter fuscus]|uniref:Polyketide synthase n=1 Tax=Cystobacter fuscus TaxID=43 RepID=A0A250J8C5_9BACT|nr:DsbA family oxidoreductase [Cystobacter fuscus]ATB39681.1 polyketide synthase [Cystobacter fuscus]
MKIDVFSDIVCPWCFIGTERLARALDSLGMASTARVEHHAFMLRSDTPRTGNNLHEELRAKYGVDPQAMFERVESAARESGISLELSRQPLTYPTQWAHTLLRHAGPKGTQKALARALFGAYFLEGRNIADPVELRRLAIAHGFSDEEATRLLEDPREYELTQRESDEAHQRGIRGVPFFVFNERFAVSGAQPESVFREAIQRAVTG